MPRYYCDYCDTHLTHDSPSVRKQHNAGYKHKANVRDYYQQFEQLQTQSLIDQKIKERMGQTGAMYQIGIGAAFNQQLASFPGMLRPRLPILPPPALPIPGAPAQLPPGFRPPVLPRPGFPGYGMPPQMAPIPGQPQMSSTLPMQMNGMMPRPLPPPPPMSGPEGGTTNPTSSGAPPPGLAQPMYHHQQQPPNPTGGAPPTSAPTDSYAYAPPAPPGSTH